MDTLTPPPRPILPSRNTSPEYLALSTSFQRVEPTRLRLVEPKRRQTRREYTNYRAKWRARGEQAPANPVQDLANAASAEKIFGTMKSNLTARKGNDPYNYEEEYPEDVTYEETAPNAPSSEHGTPASPFDDAPKILRKWFKQAEDAEPGSILSISLDEDAYQCLEDNQDTVNEVVRGRHRAMITIRTYVHGCIFTVLTNTLRRNPANPSSLEIVCNIDLPLAEKHRK
ncbi:uncharacterized protein EV420DRAFT_365417 [Desarmillaria tabescens]|uniref:Uncharacterized protein n=1 Tax=Armillaria tabescens TaxID=1929756 RepID=A0AA39KEZ7_ARMTA|nr:uncharacterized protein EV420DRAFT_365417 [Desarmillaria tabescens]KAK0458574.1 hypothetical protein EV420DRAFT_365417 [Desarmillaria tabescens]